LIAIAKAAEQPPKKQSHDRGGVRTSPDGDMDEMVNVRTLWLDRWTMAGRSMSKGTAYGVDAREFRAHQHQLR
jgi:hypothetical protein